MSPIIALESQYRLRSRRVNGRLIPYERHNRCDSAILDFDTNPCTQHDMANRRNIHEIGLPICGLRGAKIR
jgi:hypothetical protein